MTRAGKDEPELKLAAEALEAELRTFEEFAESLSAAPLNSQKALERAAKLLGSVAEMDERLSTQVQRLVAAIGSARDRQQQQAEAIQKRAVEIQGRANVLQALMEEYAKLGRSAAELNGQMQALAGSGPPDAPGGATDLGRALQGMGAWADEARELVERAKREEFPDIGRLADALRQQLLAAKNRAQLLLPQTPTA